MVRIFKNNINISVQNCKLNLEFLLQLLKTLCQLGRDANYVCWRPQKGSIADSAQSSLRASRGSNEGGSSDEDDDDEEEASTSSHPQREDATTVDPTATTCHEKTPIALVDYILNVVRNFDIFTNLFRRYL